MSNHELFRFKEQLFKQLFIVQDRIKPVANRLARICDLVLFFGGLFFLSLIIARLGFSSGTAFLPEYYPLSRKLFLLVFFAKYVQEIIRLKTRKQWAWWIEGLVFVFSSMVLFSNWASQNFFLHSKILEGSRPIILTLGILFISEAYKLFRLLNSVRLSPSLLFALSFLIMIFAGSGLLMLPDTHIGHLSFLDALFTSASAVCVTGLVAVDTATAFTLKGHIIILALIQIGGLGIMAFTGFFAYAFTGTVSYKDRFLLKDIFSADTMNDIFKLLVKILLLTFLLEGLGALLIYLTIKDSVPDPVFFSLFHAISAFCNAGFSTVKDGLMNTNLTGNNGFFLIISLLIILGGIGFPVLIGLYALFRDRIQKLFNIRTKRRLAIQPLNRNIANRIALVTTAILLLAGAVIYLIVERDHTLMSADSLSQGVISFFNSVTARTAGFNMVDMSQWRMATVFLTIGLMWIGASPGSTGGGIKTTTFAIAFQAVYHFIRGRNQIEIRYRQIGSETISRVLVVIVLSIFCISLGFFALLLSEPSQNPVYLLFETVSAFSTVGLSISGTPLFGPEAKGILIGLMFVGRVGPLTLLSGLFVTHKIKYYRLPEQDLIIN